MAPAKHGTAPGGIPRATESAAPGRNLRTAQATAHDVDFRLSGTFVGCDGSPTRLSARDALPVGERTWTRPLDHRRTLQPPQLVTCTHFEELTHGSVLPHSASRTLGSRRLYRGDLHLRNTSGLRK